MGQGGHRLQVETEGNRCSHMRLQVGSGHDITATCPTALAFDLHILNMNRR